MRRYFVLFLIILISCTPKSVDALPQIVSVYVTPATVKWLPFVYKCGARSPGTLVSRSFDIAYADISLRVGNVLGSDMLSYQIGETEVVAVVNASNPVTALTQRQLAELFSGQINNWADVGGDDADVQLWVYHIEDDLQVAFSGAVLGDRTLSSLARQAASPDVMREAIAEDTNALGILSRDDANASVRIIEMENKIALPVLAIVSSEPSALVEGILICLQ